MLGEEKEVGREMWGPEQDDKLLVGGSGADGRVGGCEHGGGRGRARVGRGRAGRGRACPFTHPLASFPSPSPISPSGKILENGKCAVPF